MLRLQKETVQAEVTKAVTLGKEPRIRYAFKSLTKDGRELLAFVPKEEWDKFKE
jgi:hypothetical protein